MCDMHRAPLVWPGWETPGWNRAILAACHSVSAGVGEPVDPLTAIVIIIVMLRIMRHFWGA